MRPIASTWVASMQNIAAPESERLLMWVKCQSLAEPSSAEYWHIGDTMMRLASFRPRNSIGENRALMLGNPGVGGRREPNVRSRRRDYQRQRRRWPPCAISGAYGSHQLSASTRLPGSSSHSALAKNSM